MSKLSSHGIKLTGSGGANSTIPLKRPDNAAADASAGYLLPIDDSDIVWVSLLVTVRVVVTGGANAGTYDRVGCIAGQVYQIGGEDLAIIDDDAEPASDLSLGFGAILGGTGPRLVAVLSVDPDLQAVGAAVQCPTITGASSATVTVNARLWIGPGPPQANLPIA